MRDDPGSQPLQHCSTYNFRLRRRSPSTFPPDQQAAISKPVPKKKSTIRQTPTTPKLPLSNPTQLKSCSAAPDTTTESYTKNPHIWSTIEKTKLLELLIDESPAGRATNNGNLKK
ncbi:hypothetical protein VP01_751g4 [Puccinia sorghi]|uniref:Uncharacterized protein n=1 Tax=Puccinia sorghi TaxID=27349 RepID=A0A0L6UC63_9BASI|nr:hypothetical protein VP01_751g4 [Puccinia sorghi]